MSYLRISSADSTVRITIINWRLAFRRVTTKKPTHHLKNNSSFFLQTDLYGVLTGSAEICWILFLHPWRYKRLPAQLTGLHVDHTTPSNMERQRDYDCAVQQQVQLSENLRGSVTKNFTIFEQNEATIPLLIYKILQHQEKEIHQVLKQKQVMVCSSPF